MPTLRETQRPTPASATTARDRSKYMALVNEIKEMVSEDAREIVITHVSRTQNKVSHGLAAYGRSTPRTAVWLGSGTGYMQHLHAVQVAFTVYFQQNSKPRTKKTPKRYSIPWLQCQDFFEAQTVSVAAPCAEAPRILQTQIHI